MWADKDAKAAKVMLSLPDVAVTNQSDKDEQLKKVLALDSRVAEVMEASTGVIDPRSTETTGAIEPDLGARARSLARALRREARSRHSRDQSRGENGAWKV